MSNFAELARHDGNDVQFLVRWRGKQSGPYSVSVIEAKLQSLEIGLLHEIYHNDRWITIRDYLSEREAVLNAEHLANEELKRQAKEEALKQQERERLTEALLEERSKAAQPELMKSQQPLAPLPTTQLPTPDRSLSGMKILGVLLFLGGAAVTAYFYAAFDTSVDSGFGRVNNLGLMADRQNGIIIGVGLIVVGTIMLAIGSREKN